MSEIKAFTLVNTTSNPAAEILVINFAFACGITLLYQLLQILIVNVT